MGENVNHISDKGFVSGMYEELQQLNSKKTKKKKKRKENGQRSEVSFQRRYNNGEEANEKMLSITGHQENASQNHNEIPLNAHQAKLKDRQ